MPNYTYTDASNIQWNYTLDASNNASIGDGTDNYGNATTLGTDLSGAITIPGTVIDASSNPHTVTQINKYAFSDTWQVTDFIIPDSVTSIGNYSFYNCTSLVSIDLPNSVTTIGQSAFFYVPK